MESVYYCRLESRDHFSPTDHFGRKLKSPDVLSAEDRARLAAMNAVDEGDHDGEVLRLADGASAAVGTLKRAVHPKVS